MSKVYLLLLTSIAAASALAGCAMKEEVKRIEELKMAQRQRELSRSNNLTGEQVFIRSCNTCHPGGKKGPQAPSLDEMADHFPDDASLAKFLRHGKGTMPAQSKETINDVELQDLILYLRQLDEERRKESSH